MGSKSHPYVILLIKTLWQNPLSHYLQSYTLKSSLIIIFSPFPLLLRRRLWMPHNRSKRLLQRRLSKSRKDATCFYANFVPFFLSLYLWFSFTIFIRLYSWIPNKHVLQLSFEHYIQCLLGITYQWIETRVGKSCFLIPYMVIWCTCLFRRLK